MSNVDKETIDFKLKSCLQVIGRMYNAESVKNGGNVFGAYFLLNVDSKDGSYATEVASRMGMKSSSLSRMIKNLENENMIERKSDKNDKRKVKILLTEAGKEKKNLAKAFVKSFNQLIEQTIGVKRKEELIKTLEDITLLAENKLENLKK